MELIISWGVSSIFEKNGYRAPEGKKYVWLRYADVDKKNLCDTSSFFKTSNALTVFFTSVWPQNTKCKCNEPYNNV